MAALIALILSFAGAPASTPVVCAATPTLPMQAGSPWAGMQAYSWTNWTSPPSITLGAAECADLRSRVAATRADAEFILLHEAIHARLEMAGMQPSQPEECLDETIEERRVPVLLTETFTGRPLMFARAAVAVFQTRERYALGCAPGLQVGT